MNEMKTNEIFRGHNIIIILGTTLIAFLILVNIALAITDIPNQGSNGFPYPRGTAPAYGYMGCESGNKFISDGATLIHFGWATSITPKKFVGINDNDFFGVYFPDEPKKPFKNHCYAQSNE
jgi:hypothetical protein